MGTLIGVIISIVL